MKADLRRAALLAEKTLLHFGTDSLPVDPAAMLQKIPGVRLMSTRLAQEVSGLRDPRLLGMDASVEAALISGEDGYLVLYRKDISVERRRFNFAHELGHLALRHGGGLHEEWQEQEANCFALHLLMPEPLMQRLRQMPDPVYAEQLALLCFLPVRWAAMRTRVGLSEDPAAQARLEEQLGAYLETMTLPDLQGEGLHRMRWI